MDKENIKNFILETVAVQNNRTVEGQLLYFRNGGILFFMLFIWILFWATFNSESANTSTTVIFILTILLAIVIAIYSLRKHRHQAKNWSIENNKPLSNPRKDNSFAGVGGAIVTAIIIIIVRNIEFSENILMIYVITAMILGVLILTHSVCIYQHYTCLKNIVQR